MCVDTLYRFPVPEYALKHKGNALKGYRNGAWVFSKKQKDKLEWLCACYPERVNDLQEIPCGQCIECRIAYSKMWAQRCIAEAQMSESDCYFLTLTYDDEHLPAPISTIPRSSPPGFVLKEPIFLSPLCKEDMTLFLKRLRINFKRKYDVEDVRFLYCGEYGEKNGRCHFHMLLFNVKLPDLELAFNRSLMSGKDISYFKSDFISDTWDKGFVSISPLTWDNAAYTCRYVLKKRKGCSEEEYQEACVRFGVSPLPAEFINMSRNPGIGRSYYEAYKGFIYNYDVVQLPDGKQVKPCRYYDDLYDLEFPEALEAIKNERERKIARRKYINALHGVKSDEEQARQRENNLKRKISKLKREL